MKIVIEVIPHLQQRYNTVGDWQVDGNNIHIKVSDTGDDSMNFLIGRHEMDEAILCYFNDVTTKQVDDYDFSHPEAGSDDLSANLDAPYQPYHNDALAAEWMMSRLLNVNWKDYTKRLEELWTQYQENTAHGNETTQHP